MDGIVGKIIFYVAILFIMMIPGIILKKFKLCGDGIGKGLSNLVLYIAQPALVFYAYLVEYSREILVNSIIVLFVSIIIHAIFAVVAILVFKRAKDSARRMLRFATVFSNAAFMGIPLIEAAINKEATIYATVYNITFNLFLWSLGVYFCTAHRDMDGDGEVDTRRQRVMRLVKSISKAFIHPVTIAAFIGIIFFCLSLHDNIPAVAMQSIEMLKALVAPLAMVVIGLRLADINLKGFFKDFYMYVFIALRHFVLPIIVVLLLVLLRFIGLPINDTVYLVLIIMAATPAATSATMFAEKYDCDSAYVSKLVAASTILCIGSIPLIIMFANLF